MKKLLVIIGFLLVVTLLLLVSCARAPAEEDERTGRVIPPAPEIEMEEEKMSSAEPAPPVVIDAGEQWATERMIVRTGDMSLIVEDVPDAMDQINVIADGLGGYVVSSRVWKERERLVGSIAVRVPAEYFDDAMSSLRELSVEVTSEQTSSKDVTEEYVDLSAKLQNLEATEEQLLKIMEKAETVEDILDVQRELSRTRGDIEQTKARMQYLERTSATSLIQVSLEQSKLAVDFTAHKSRVKEREKLWFYIEIAGGFPPYSFEWDFGDGTTSTEETPTHTYNAGGSYTVSLTVTDDRGNTDTQTRTNYITVLPGWSAGSIASGAWNGLVTFGHVLANIFIWIGIFSPVWIVIGGIVYWWQWRRRKRTKTE